MLDLTTCWRLRWVSLILIYHTDDMLLIAGGRRRGRTFELSETGVSAVITRIRELGLKVTSGKTEAVWFRPTSNEETIVDVYDGE